MSLMYEMALLLHDNRKPSYRGMRKPYVITTILMLHLGSKAGTPPSIAKDNITCFHFAKAPFPHLSSLSQKHVMFIQPCAIRVDP